MNSKSSSEGDKLKQIIENLSINKSDLARYLGKHPSYFTDVIGREKLDLVLLQKIRVYIQEKYSYDILTDFPRLSKDIPMAVAEPSAEDKKGNYWKDAYTSAIEREATLLRKSESFAEELVNTLLLVNKNLQDQNLLLKQYIDMNVK